MMATRSNQLVETAGRVRQTALPNSLSNCSATASLVDEMYKGASYLSIRLLLLFSQDYFQLYHSHGVYAP
jgi:hypothetical protein